MLGILISLTLSTVPSEAPTPEAPSCWIDQGFGRAPRNNLVLDIPLVQSAEGGYLFPAETTAEVLRRLRCLERWPDAAQIVLDEQAAVLTTPPAPVENGVPWLHVVLVSGGALLAGVLVGLIAGG